MLSKKKLNNTFITWVVLCLVFPLVGCVTTSRVQKDYCNSLNIHKKGYEDALKGRSLKSFNKIVNMCTQYEITLNQEEYTKGWEKGLKVLCTSKSGYERGLKGESNPSTCQKFTQFTKAYTKGNKKCWYDEGHTDAINGWSSSHFSQAQCVVLLKDQNQKEYNKGWNIGLKIFCTSAKGHEWGLAGRKNPNICPKLSAVKFKEGWNKGIKGFCTYSKGYEFGVKGDKNPNVCPDSMADFTKGYISGVQQYEANKRHQERLELERRRVHVEQERARVEQVQRQQLIDLEAQRVEDERRKRQERIRRRAERSRQKRWEAQRRIERWQREDRRRENRRRMKENRRRDFYR